MLRDLRFAVAILAVVVLSIALRFVQPLIVFGSAKDPEGTPIAGVLGTGNYRSGAKDRAAKRGKSSFFSGCFLCASLRLRVSAPGFESERFQLSAAHAFDHGDRVVVSRSLFGVIQRLRVTLYPERTVATRRIDTELTFNDGKTEIVAALDPKLPRRAKADMLHEELRRMTRGERTVAAYVALESETTADDSIVVAAPSPDPAMARWPQPTRARLVLHNEVGGFIAVDPLSGIPDYNGFSATLRRLRDAPEDGYEPVLPLDFDRGHIDGRHFYFYCRLGDRYGKGELTAVEVHSSRPTYLRAHVRIWLNESGERVMPIGR